jgi:hypothetical protein
MSIPEAQLVAVLLETFDRPNAITPDDTEAPDRTQVFALQED